MHTIPRPEAGDARPDPEGDARSPSVRPQARARTAAQWAGGRGWLCAMAAVVALGLLLRIPSLFEPMWYGDEGFFASIASDIRGGGVLYRDAWDLKPPLIFWTYAGIQSLFGTSVTALHAASIAALLATYAGVALAARRLGSPPRVVAALAVVTVMLAGPLLEANLAMTENFMVAFTALAAAAWLHATRPGDGAGDGAGDGGNRDRWFVAVGLLFGMAANYKQVALWDAAAFGLMTLLAVSRPWRPFALMAVAGLAANVPFVAYALVTRSVPEYWDAVAGVLSAYSEVAPHPSFALRMARYVPVAAMVTWLLVLRLRGRRPPRVAIAPLWLAASFAGSVSSTFAFPHYLMQPVPALALTLALLPLREPAGRRSWRSPAVPVRTWALRTAMAATFVLPSWWVVDSQFGHGLYSRGWPYHDRYYSAFWDYATGDIDARGYASVLGSSALTVSDVRDAMTVRDSDPTLFVWGQLPWVYAASGFRNPAKHYSSFNAVILPETLGEMERLLDAEPPDYVLRMQWAHVPFPGLEALLAADYREVRHEDEWTLYLRNDLVGR